MSTWAKEQIDNPFFRNTYILMVMRVLSTLFGYLFWVLAARTMAAGSVGIASGSESTALLLSGFAHLGLGYGIVRRLAHTDNPNGLINFALITAGALAVILAAVFLLGVNFWSPKLAPLLDSFYTVLLFILLVLASTLSRIFFSIFLATRRMIFGLLKQTIQSILGVVLLLALRGSMPGYIAALSAYTFALVLSIALSFPFLAAAQPGYKFSLKPRMALLSSFTKYSFVNYLCDQVQAAPSSLLPLIVLNIFGADAGAYFFIPWSIGRGLVTLAGSVSETLFAEGSYSPELNAAYTRKSARLAILLALGMALGVLVGGRFLLSIYGQDYTANSLRLLYTVTLTVLPEVLILIIVSSLRVQDRLRSVFGILAVCSLLGIALSWGGMSRFGTDGAGYGWLAAQTVVLVFTLIWQRSKRNKES